jgi:exopolyphosphatase/guanosine-5'-triphosphate,3'-diphosphate pyrophosphatase
MHAASRVAVFDIGSTSIQLLVAEVGVGTWCEVARAESVTRLAEGLVVSGQLRPPACERTLRAVRTLSVRARAMGAARQFAVGTRPFRAAADAEAFAMRLESALGGPLEILSERREASLGFAGAIRALPHVSGLVLSVDIGGGSTELVLGTGGRIVEEASLPIGAVVLSERHLRHDPPAPLELAAMEAEIGAMAREAGPIARMRDGTGALRVLIGSGGTIVTLGAMCAGQDGSRATRVHGWHLDAPVVRRAYAKLAACAAAERGALPGLDPGRAPVIVAGAAILHVLLAVTGATTLVVSDQGLRHAILDELATGAGAPRPPGVD